MEEQNVIFNFDDTAEKDTYHHLAALGEKSERVLKHLKLGFGEWFTQELLTIEKAYKFSQYVKSPTNINYKKIMLIAPLMFFRKFLLPFTHTQFLFH